MSQNLNQQRNIEVDSNKTCYRGILVISFIDKLISKLDLGSTKL